MPTTETIDSTPSLSRPLAAEALGTALLLATVVGSGVMAERLSGGNVAIALLANTLATGAGLVALILTFGPISGAHFNPVVSLVEVARRTLPWRALPGYLLAQVVGGVLGVMAAHAMFGLPLLTVSTHVRAGAPQLFSEVVATFGLVAVILGTAARRPGAAPFAVGAYVTAAYWFTASTSFANPAVTIARAATDTFAGIRPVDAPAFIGAQLVGGAVAFGVMRWFQAPPRVAASAEERELVVASTPAE